MSWQVLLMEFPAEARSVKEVRGDHRADSLGNRGMLADRLEEVFPDIDFEEPSWGVMTGHGFSIQVDLGEEMEVDHVMLHVQGGGEDALKAVWKASQTLNARAVDVHTGELLNFVEDARGLRVWRGLDEFFLESEDSVY